MGKDAELILRNTKIFLDDIVDMEDPHCVLDEVRTTVDMAFPGIDLDRLEMAHADTVRLFEGKYPGYKKCSTEYHDLRHTMEVFLAMARIIHGASIEGMRFDHGNVATGLVSALLHDTGYIQSVDDNDGTGGKYTLTHVSRSVDFMKIYFAENGYSAEDAASAECLIDSTSLTADFGKIPYPSDDIEVLGKMIFTSDLVGQMADRAYLEKLHLLYHEFVEGNVSEFSDETDLLKKTKEFVAIMRKRIMNELGSVDDYLRNHFRVRCNINRDLYSESIEKNIDHLEGLFSGDTDDYRTKLNRMGIIKRIKSIAKTP
jgi:HD superfamily phosphodiesterase